MTRDVSPVAMFQSVPTSGDLLELNLQLLLTFESLAQYSIVMPMALSKLIFFERWHCGARALTALKEASIHTFIGANIKAKVRGWIGLPFNLFINAQ